MSTSTRRAPSLWLLALAFTLSMTACSAGSTRPSIEPTKPEVRCKQPAGEPFPAAPLAGAWIEWTPPSADAPYGRARLSQAAAQWAVDAAAAYTSQAGLRGVEHACLDRHEAEGLIRQ